MLIESQFLEECLVHVPKPVLVGLVLFASAFVGWMLRSSHDANATQFSAPQFPQALPQTEPPAQPVHLTIIMPDSLSNPERHQSPALAHASSVAPRASSLTVTVIGKPDRSSAADVPSTSWAVREP